MLLKAVWKSTELTWEGGGGGGGGGSGHSEHSCVVICKVMIWSVPLPPVLSEKYVDLVLFCD